MLPVFVLLLLGLVQVGRVAGAQLTVGAAARSGARAAAVDPRPGAAIRAVQRDLPALADRLDVATVVSGGSTRTVAVTVRCTVPPIASFPGASSTGVTVRATVTMAVEAPRTVSPP